MEMRSDGAEGRIAASGRRVGGAEGVLVKAPKHFPNPETKGR